MLTCSCSLTCSSVEKETPPLPLGESEGVSGELRKERRLQRAEERLQVLPLAVGEVDVEPLLVVLDGLLDVLRPAVVEVRRAGGEATQRRHAELREVRPHAVSASA